jgi:hypothetical protein
MQFFGASGCLAKQFVIGRQENLYKPNPRL